MISSTTEDRRRAHVDERLTAQRRRIAALMRSDALTGADVHAALRQVAELGAELLEVERVGVWRFDGSGTLTCVDRFRGAVREHESGATLSRAALPAFFRAVDEGRVLVAARAAGDPRTAGLSAHGVDALLAAPIFFRGAVHGLVCLEHARGARAWELWEELVAGTLADLVGTVLEAVERVAREGELRRYRAELEQRVEQRTLELQERNDELRREVAERQRVEAQLREMAIRDPLTDAINRRHFFELAEKELHRANRYGRPLCLAMVDADHFKDVNDRYGHLVGDQVLRTLVEVCRSSLRRMDVLARYGGEELLILLPETALPAAAAVVDRLREAVARQPVPSREGVVRCTVSAGVVMAGPGEGNRPESLESLLRRADAACYAAKAAGRNQVVAAELPLPRATG